MQASLQRSVQLAVSSCRPGQSLRGSAALTYTHPCPPAGPEGLLNCVQARAECLERFGPQAEEYTQAGRFLRFRKDEEGAISVLSFFNYVMRRNAMLQTVSVMSGMTHSRSHRLQAQQEVRHAVSIESSIPSEDAVRPCNQIPFSAHMPAVQRKTAPLSFDWSFR